MWMEIILRYQALGVLAIKCGSASSLFLFLCPPFLQSHISASVSSFSSMHRGRALKHQSQQVRKNVFFCHLFTDPFQSIFSEGDTMHAEPRLHLGPLPSAICGLLLRGDLQMYSQIRSRVDHYGCLVECGAFYSRRTRAVIPPIEKPSSVWYPLFLLRTFFTDDFQ